MLCSDLLNSVFVHFYCCAGIMGYAWVAVLHYWMQLTFSTTLVIATAMPAVWLAVFHALLRLSRPRSRQSIHFGAEPAAAGGLWGLADAVLFVDVINYACSKQEWMFGSQH